jgi:uncharacterized protein (TIGR00369 family)
MDGSIAEQGWSSRIIETGEWAGWERSESDPFELHAGPFYTRPDAAGGWVCAFRAERKHMNGGGFMHGGCLATFADYAIFMFAREHLQGTGSVTASLNTEFLDGAREGELIEAAGEVTRAGGSMVFVRGIASAGGRPLLNFSAIIKKVRRKG